MESKTHIHEIPALFRSTLKYWLAVCCLLTSVVSAQRSGQTSAATISEITEALRLRDFAKGLQLARLVVQSQPEDPRAWTLMGIALSGLGRTAESLNAFQKALEIRPDFVPALEGAAQLEYNAGRPDARALLDRLVVLSPREPTAHAMLGALAFRDKDCELAVTHFKQSWEVIYGRPEALTEYGDCLFQTRRLEEAIPVFSRITELLPNNWHTRYDLAVVQFRAGHNEEAIHTLRPLIEGPNPNVDALNLIAAAYEANRQTPLAVAALQQGIKLAPRDMNNYLDLATISLDHGSFQVGVDVLNAGIQAIPDSAALYLERGVLFVQMLKYDQATADFEMASKLSPLQNTSTVALGISLLQHNEPSQSLQVVRARLQKSPDDPILNYLLAEILLRKGVQPDTLEFQEAVSAARRSIQRNPDFVLAHNVLSELYLRAGNAQEAIAQSNLALKADPNDQSALYNLIMALRKSGNSSEIPALVQRLAQATTSAREREADTNRFKLVEQGVGQDKDTNVKSPAWLNCKLTTLRGWVINTEKKEERICTTSPIGSRPRSASRPSGRTR